MPTIWLLRHGKAGDLLGDYDRLSETGFAQARLAGRSYRHLAPIDRLISGTMRRQRETAGAFAEAFGGTPDLQTDARWNEFDHVSVIHSAMAAGILPPKERSPAAFTAFFGAAMGRWASGEYEDEYSEPYVDFQGRVEAALTELSASLGSGETALVATSGGVISASVRMLLGLEPAAAFKLNTVMVNGGMSRVVVSAGKPMLAMLNSDLHLQTEAGMLTFS